ncbi:MAG: DNA-binding protein [Spirochaetaceae bacterium]|jgi:hypothetical protein|nr:DNA-binding protein [Spirochaetaceae bacterium]
MTSAEVAEITGYKPITVRKYALVLGVPFIEVNKWKAYMWSDDDIKRFREAVISPDGKRDKRGRPKTKTDT